MYIIFSELTIILYPVFVLYQKSSGYIKHICKAMTLKQKPMTISSKFFGFVVKLL